MCRPWAAEAVEFPANQVEMDREPFLAVLKAETMDAELAQVEPECPEVPAVRLPASGLNLIVVLGAPD